jgi:aryl-alcohol dehydrogenase-like predicted oxidoreductase
VVGGGVLTGKYHTAPDPAAAPDSRRAKVYANTPRTSGRALAIAAETQAIAQETGRSAAQVALSWVRQQGRQIVPLLGARTEAQLRDNLACLECSLSPEHLARLDAASAIEMGFPHEFISTPRIVDQRHGGTQHLQDWDRDW